MLDRFVDRLPSFLVFMSLALLGYVAIDEVERPELLLAGVPSAVLFVIYLLSGRSR